MKPEEMDITVKLLAESFVEFIMLSVGCVSLIRYLVKQHLIERRAAAISHPVTLTGFYKGKQEMNRGEEEEEDDDDVLEVEELGGTVEVCFDKRVANASPRNALYICNMAVKQSHRRRGTGWNLLKASEELISQISSICDVYLHCRMIDYVPFNMYTKAGYSIVKTDSIWVLLMLQRRKHLMCKELAVSKNSSELDTTGSDMEFSSQLDTWKS